MNNHQKSTFYPLSNFSSNTQQSSRKIALLGQGLEKSTSGNKLNFANRLFIQRLLKD
ncbi:hypothetical protein [Bathymodiolus thermophilus thioautotrophic gill symbiont]|uniref:hypothetical protein n=1 Tax=Bathymodiolus thermophilus thioautotrophic gill symbiont TaxID=2360 RepID=UPI0013DFDF9D|nr:hypothetical protein [Bathymodiolus thermophilus thioautotrophic gill symbiont]